MNHPRLSGVSAPVAGFHFSARCATSVRERPILGQHQRRQPAGIGHARRCPPHRRRRPARAGRRSDARGRAAPDRARRRAPGARATAPRVNTPLPDDASPTRSSVALAGPDTQTRTRSASETTRSAISGGHRIDLQRERHRQVLLERGPFEQDRALADDPEAIQRREPLVAVGDVSVVAALDAHRRRDPRRSRPSPDSRALRRRPRRAPTIATRSPGAIVSACSRSGRRRLISLFDVGRSRGPAGSRWACRPGRTRGSGGLAGARLEIGERGSRQRDCAEPGRMMRGVGVIVGPARHADPQLLGDALR